MSCMFVWGPTRTTPVGCARGRNAWRLIIGDGFHMDVVPCVTRGDLDRVCDTWTGKFEPTDGTGYREWFDGKTDVTNGHLKTVTRLLKFMRNHKGSFDVPSVVLTTLIGHTRSLQRAGKEIQGRAGYSEDRFQSYECVLASYPAYAQI